MEKLMFTRHLSIGRESMRAAPPARSAILPAVQARQLVGAPEHRGGSVRTLPGRVSHSAADPGTPGAGALGPVTAQANLLHLKLLAERDPELAAFVRPLTDAQWLALVAAALLAPYMPQTRIQWFFGGGGPFGSGGWSGFGGLSNWLKKIRCFVVCIMGGCSAECGCKCGGGDAVGLAEEIGGTSGDTGNKVPGCAKYWDGLKCTQCPGSSAWQAAWDNLQKGACKYGESPAADCVNKIGEPVSELGTPQPSACSCNVYCYDSVTKKKNPPGKG